MLEAIKQIILNISNWFGDSDNVNILIFIFLILVIPISIAIWLQEPTVLAAWALTVAVSQLVLRK